MTFSPRLSTWLLLAILLPAVARADDAPATFQTLQVTPDRLVLDGPRDARRVLVTGRTAVGGRVDLTSKATYEAPEGLRFDATGFAHPVKDGEYTVKVRAGGLDADLPVTVRNASNPRPVSFVRDVEPILARVGCNAGTCHGSAKGKRGFKLSLRGYDPAFDYEQLVEDLAGRRFNRSAPEQSLMLLKPTNGVPHEGGYVLDPASPSYAALRDWIAQGVQSDVGKTARVASLEVLPPAVELAREGHSQQLLVIAHYPDGTTRDVTADAVYSSSVPDVATVTSSGLVTAARRGEAAILVRYEGAFGSENLTVMGDRSGFAWAPMPENNEVDRLVNRKLERVKVLPSETCTDAEFLRRVSIDLTGLPPTPEQVRAFLDDPSDPVAKRNRVIDELIGGREFVAHWTHKWADLFQVNRKLIGDKPTWTFLRWIERAVAEDRPYDAMVRELLTATGSSHESPAVNYFRAQKEPSVALENATQLFLGIRFSCNKCHDHPFEKWTQGQYYGLAAYWGRVGVKQGMRPGEQVVFDQDGGEVLFPKDGHVVAPSFPFEHAGRVRKDAARREQLAEWLTSPENPYFARSVVNRVWSYFLGKGIIDPVDDIRSGNPPSNPELLEFLEKDFVAHKFDLRHLMRTIARSRTYQLSYKTNRFNEDDSINFSHAVPRRLTAEELLDAIDVATGRAPRFPGVPAGFRADQLPDSQVGGGFLDLFGRPPRETPCECERSSEVSLSQALNLVNGPTIAEALVDPDGRIARLLRPNPDDTKIIEEMYLAALSRLPTADELAKSREYFSKADTKAEAAQDLLWALINSPAFLFNR
ncbi:MAG TPA: DUF1553 domain-containing protein [Isosphaeraceae bacterium]|jgi:hypothetical protein|nr:DUF1553 domain-containing protein [Isosphaeraceae bacterium]